MRKYLTPLADRVAMAITTTPFFMGNIFLGEDNKMKKLRIRKLTEAECYRFMGFEKKDYEACRDVGQSKSSIYHQAGDSIVTTCLIGIFGELIGADYGKVIDDYADRLHNEVA